MKPSIYIDDAYRSTRNTKTGALAFCLFPTQDQPPKTEVPETYIGQVRRR